MRNMHVTMKDIGIVKGVEADEANGGSMVHGVILGPKRSVSRWRIKQETQLFNSRPEAETEVKRRNLSANIFNAMSLDMVGGRQLTTLEVVNLIRQHGKELKAVLADQKYRKILDQSS